MSEHTMKIHCNRCMRNTNHQQKAEYIQQGSEDVCDGRYGISWKYQYFIYECCGCESIVFYLNKWFSEQDGDCYEQYCPPRAYKCIPDWYNDLPDGIYALLREVHSAINNKLFRVAMMGLRSVIDFYMNNKITDIGNFSQKLEQMLHKGFISNTDKERLLIAIEAGHAAAHREYVPDSDATLCVLEIVEHLLHQETLRENASFLKTKVPEDTRKKKRSK